VNGVKETSSEGFSVNGVKENHTSMEEAAHCTRETTNGVVLDYSVTVEPSLLVVLPSEAD
jgi:hypothetical protein